MLVSVHLNDIGYRLMRSHHYAIAHKYLSMAIASNPENISAEINQFALDLIQKNGDSLAGLEWKFPPEMEENINEKLKGFANLEVLLNTYGFFDFPSLTFMLSRTFFENGLPIQAYQFLQRTLELEPTVYRYYADGAMFVLNYNRTDIAMEILDKLRKNVTITDLDFEDQNIDLKIQAQILQMSGKLDEAVSLLRQSATDEPKRASTLRFLATIYERAGQFDKVVETCHEQIQLFPQDFRAWLQLGLAHSFLNQFDEALNANNKALEINPRFSLAHKNNAFIYSKMENWAKVIESLQAFLKTNPSYYDALLEIARSYRRLDDKVNAIKYYQEYLLSLGKGSPESIAIQVELDEYRGDMDED
ncbi:MAG: tetratricopeptide repeat protein [Verrucomicrobia bacterium]|nr:tetratricopeptide repeat protein [Verrucomicrobiota bacterium]